MAYKRLKKKKMTGILALKFSASHELPLRTELVRKSSKLFGFQRKHSSAEQTIRVQVLKISSKDEQLSFKHEETRLLCE